MLTVQAYAASGVWLVTLLRCYDFKVQLGDGGPCREKSTPSFYRFFCDANVSVKWWCFFLKTPALLVHHWALVRGMTFIIIVSLFFLVIFLLFFFSFFLDLIIFLAPSFPPAFFSLTLARSRPCLCWRASFFIFKKNMMWRTSDQWSDYKSIYGCCDTQCAWIAAWCRTHFDGVCVHNLRWRRPRPIFIPVPQHCHHINCPHTLDVCVIFCVRGYVYTNLSCPSAASVLFSCGIMFLSEALLAWPK